MLKQKSLITLLVPFILVGCATTQTIDDDYLGTTDQHYRYFDKKTFEKGNYFGDNRSCIPRNGKFDIRLDTVKFNGIFDGTLENISEGAFLGLNKDAKNTNELGVFLTIEELDRSKTTSLVNQNKKKINNRLIYTSYSRKKTHPINQKNKLVFSGENNGNDLRFIVEVREFDKKNGESVLSMMNLISSEASKYASGTPLVGEILDKLGTSAKSGLFRDDIILYYETEFVPCGSYAGKNQMYLSEGQLLFLRHTQRTDFKKAKLLEWDNNEHDLFNYILKKNGDGTETSKLVRAKQYSYISFNLYNRK